MPVVRPTWRAARSRPRSSPRPPSGAAPTAANPTASATAAPTTPTAAASRPALRALEGGESAIAFASGVAAAQALFQTLAPGDHVVCDQDAYYGVRKGLQVLLGRWGLALSFVDTADLAATERAFTPRDPRAVDRDALQPAAQGRRHRGAGGARARPRRARGLRQHLRHAGAAAPARARLRRGHAQHHQVLRRPQRRDGRRAHLRQARRAGRAPEGGPAPRRRHPQPARLLAAAARRRDPAAAGAPAGGERARARALAPRPSRVTAVHYPGPARPSRPCDRRAPDERVRRDALVPRRGRRARCAPASSPAPACSSRPPAWVRSRA